jgi:Flp pilus assembly pilin Flp
LSTLTSLNREESSHALAEYALIAALLAFAATAGIGSLASAIKNGFTHVSNLLNSAGSGSHLSGH